MQRIVLAICLIGVFGAVGCNRLERKESRESEKDADRDDPDRRRPDPDRKAGTEKPGADKDDGKEAGDPDAINPNLSPAEAREVWLKRLAEPNPGKDVILGAARFFSVYDKPLGEKLILRGQAMDPNGPWRAEMGRLYYLIMVGATSMTPQGTVGSVNLADAHGPYAKEIRKRLSVSTDVTLLAMAGQALGTAGRTLYGNRSIDFDPVALGKTYLDQALKLDPQSILVHQIVLNIRFQDRGGHTPSIPKGSSPEAEYRMIEALPEAQRFFRLSLLAEAAYLTAEQFEAAKSSPEAARTALETARKSAQEALILAPKFPSDPDCGTAIYNANMVLGLLANRAGNRPSAVEFMLAASKAPTTEELAYSANDFSLKLPELLFQLGERDSVAEFLERFGQGNIFEKGWLLESAKAIRSGKKPLWVVK
jgi:hypothetical protein